jgi:hypothetical protein
MIKAMQYAEVYPLELEENYPYVAVQNACQYDASRGVVTVKTATPIATGSSSALKSAIASGPVSIAIEADTMVF